MPDDSERKPADEAEGADGVGIKRAREILGDLVHRAGFSGERIVLTMNGRQSAALVSMRDFERLRALDTAAVA